MLLDAEEKRPPLWAIAAPFLYLLACAACIHAVVTDPGTEVGIYGLLVAVGLVPAFALPAVFSTRPVKLGASEGGLLVDGRAFKLDDARVERADRGAARLHVEVRGGRRRTFLVASYADAMRLAAELPPVSAPAGALAA
jgi:hypothetical protein